MVYAQPFLRLVAIGSIYRDETFSWSLSLINTTGSPLEVPTAVPAAVYEAVRDLHTAPALISSHAALTTVKLNLIGTNGRYENDETVLYDFPETGGVAGSASNSPAAQVAYAVSLRTEKSRGRGHAGRFYLPLPNLSPGTTGLLDNVELQKLNPAVTEFLEALNDGLTGWRVGVTSNLGAGAQYRVTNARLGRVLDTIRSRRTSLDEGYVDLDPLTPPV